MGTALLINPNRYKHPPVPPLGLAHLSSALKAHKIGTRFLDLGFADNPSAELQAAIKEANPSAVCLTVRNVDSVLYPGTEFFLTEIKGYIDTIRGLTGAPVIIGGASIAADPTGITEYLGADYCLQGPAEAALAELLLSSPKPRKTPLIIKSPPPKRLLPEPAEHGMIDYPRYLKEGGIGGFTTHSGCSEGCPYCIEAHTTVAYRPLDSIITELRVLASHGVTHLHLCDAEFNEDLPQALAIASAIAEAGLGLRWALYMKPSPVSPGLFESLARAGAYLVTLSVDTLKRGPRYKPDVERAINLAKASGLRVAVDLLGGFPGESEAHLVQIASLLKQAGADDIVVNSCLRLYRGLPLFKSIDTSKSMQNHLIFTGDTPPLSPAFHMHITPARLRELFGKTEGIRIAGEQKGVNYQSN